MARIVQISRLLLIGLLASAAVSASDLVFYEGNGCKQDVVCEYNSIESANVNLKNHPCSNDEARSLLLRSGVKAGTKIYVYDDPNGGKGDDWALISVNPKRDLDQDVCVPSFETSSGKLEGLVKIQSHYRNGLDGKVSHVGVEPATEW